ncbi:MAG: hypothetical protein V7711_06765 [Pseudomonadales bacterium]
MQIRALILVFFAALASFGYCAEIAKQGPEPDLSYVYAPILGTGVYKAGAEKAVIFKMSLETTVLKPQEERKYHLLLPVTLGVRETDFDDILDGVIPDTLHSISVMPGVARHYKPRANWLLSPSVQLGLAHDFGTSTTAAIYSANFRSLASWPVDEGKLSWGARIRGVGQHSFETSNRQGFMQLETGLDWVIPPRIKVGDDEITFSVYTQWQRYIDNAGIKGISGERVGTENLFYLGFTAGTIRPQKILGIRIPRLGFSVIRGDGLQAITLNLGFPLFYD